MSSAYRIPDEPAPSAVARLAVNPVWPFSATLFVGAWLSTPWWIINGFALGSVTRRRETILASVTCAGVIGLAYALLAMHERHALSDAALRYVVVCVPAFRLFLSYFLLEWQLRGFQLFEHFGGRGRNGLVVVLAGGLLRFLVVSRFEGSWLVAALA